MEKWERDAVEMEGGESPDEQAMFLRKHGRGVDDCMGVSAADVMVSSDNLSPLSDRNEGAAYARGGIFNTGVVFLKHTKNAKAFAEAWNDNLNQDQGRFAPLTSDQQVFNAMVRREGHWPGLDLKALPDGFPSRGCSWETVYRTARRSIWGFCHWRCSSPVTWHFCRG